MTRSMAQIEEQKVALKERLKKLDETILRLDERIEKFSAQGRPTDVLERRIKKCGSYRQVIQNQLGVLKREITARMQARDAAIRAAFARKDLKARPYTDMDDDADAEEAEEILDRALEHLAAVDPTWNPTNINRVAS